ncbi:Protein of uncharacterised function (DUF1379) [Vibrio cholerae]|nr:Protein of uncharacterised function (DUF1379) [Vibrio cholerae]
MQNRSTEVIKCLYKELGEEMISLRNSLNSGIFIALEVGENATLCAYSDLVSFALNGSKTLEFGQVIKVMHDRMSDVNTLLYTPQMAMVS